MQEKLLVLGRIIKGILFDPVYQDFYVFQCEYKNGDILFSPVMSHQNYMVYEIGLRSLIMSGEMKNYFLLGSGSEDDMTELLYREMDAVKKSYELN